jgi:hypothetical protein
MNTVDRNILKNYFVRGAKPTAAQFAALIDSFLHKDDNILANKIEGLQEALDQKAELEAFEISDEQLKNLIDEFNAANSVIQEAQQMIAVMEELKDSISGKAKIVPESITLVYPVLITMRATEPAYIYTEILPLIAGNNVLFISDEKAVSVAPDGRITALATGISKVYVIPTEGTALYQTIQIEVIKGERNLRMTTSGALRRSGSGALRY